MATFPGAMAAAGGYPGSDDVTSGGCALLSLLACQSSCAEYASDPSAVLGATMGTDPLGGGCGGGCGGGMGGACGGREAQEHGVVGSVVDVTSEWVIERRGLAHAEPWNALPRSIRPKAKLPGFLRAGWQVLELIRSRGVHEFQWLVQDNHVVASSRCPQTYIYTHDASRAGRKRPLIPGGLTITTEGGGHFWTENGASGAAPAGTEGVFACSARDAHGELLLGKCFRRARLVRDVSDRSVKKADVEYLDTYSFLHLGVRELTEQRAFVSHPSSEPSSTMMPLPPAPVAPRNTSAIPHGIMLPQLPSQVLAQVVPNAANITSAAIAAADALWPPSPPHAHEQGGGGMGAVGMPQHPGMSMSLPTVSLPLSSGPLSSYAHQLQAVPLEASCAPTNGAGADTNSPASHSLLQPLPHGSFPPVQHEPSPNHPTILPTSQHGGSQLQLHEPLFEVNEHMLMQHGSHHNPPHPMHMLPPSEPQPLSMHTPVSLNLPSTEETPIAVQVDELRRAADKLEGAVDELKQMLPSLLPALSGLGPRLGAGQLSEFG